MYKDLDIDIVFKLSSDWHDKFMRQLKLDCAFLSSVGVVDYRCVYRSKHTRNSFETPFNSCYRSVANFVAKVEVSLQLISLADRFLDWTIVRSS